MTIQEWIESKDLLPFALPTVCFYNGEPLLREEWPKTIMKAGDKMELKAFPAGIEVLWAVVAAVAISAISIALLPKPDTPDTGYEQSPTYNLQAQANQARLYQPIADHYGKVRVWMDLAAQAYKEFGAENNEILYQLFLVGHGEYDYEALKIEDTDVATYEDLEVEYIAPGEQVTLFPTNVETSVEVSNIDLDDLSYKGPFVANQANTDTSRLSFDFVAPRGVYRQKDNGHFRHWTELDIEIQAQEIDDTGTAIGVWTTLDTPNITSSDRDPVRRTFSYTVAEGRYQCRVKRVNAQSPNILVQDDISWTGLKANITGDVNYGDVSLIAVRANATNELSSQSQFRFNVVATRKLSTWNGSVWGAPEATQDIAPAIKHMLNAGYGGDKPDSQIDLETLQTFDAVWKGRGDKFNFRFDRLGNLWNSLQTALRAGRSAPLLDGDVVTFARHSLTSTPVTMFGPENMVPNTFAILDRFPDPETEDHVIVQYFDETTWRQEEVKCVLTGDGELRPKKIQLPGITSRQQAYQEGMYEAARLRYMNTAIKFQTELEGLVPQYLELITISHDMPSWHTSGELMGVNGNTYELSQDVVFGAGTHYISFRKPNGSVAGPFVCTAGTEPNEVVIAVPLGFVPITGGSKQRTLWQFGDSSEFSGRCVVDDITPAGDRVTITAALEYDGVHDAVGTAPPIDYTYDLEGEPDEPVVTGLTVIEDENDPYTAIASWNRAPGATKYVAEISIETDVWVFAGETIGLRLPITVEEGEFQLRVAGVGKLRGPWQTINVNLQSVPRLDYRGEVYYQQGEPTGTIELGDIWIKLNTAGVAVQGFVYRETPVGTWADPNVPEYEWVQDDQTNITVLSLMNAYNAAGATIGVDLRDQAGDIKEELDILNKNILSKSYVGLNNNPYVSNKARPDGTPEGFYIGRKTGALTRPQLIGFEDDTYEVLKINAGSARPMIVTEAIPMQRNMRHNLFVRMWGDVATTLEFRVFLHDDINLGPGKISFCTSPSGADPEVITADRENGIAIVPLEINIGTYSPFLTGNNIAWGFQALEDGTNIANEYDAEYLTFAFQRKATAPDTNIYCDTCLAWGINLPYISNGAP